MAVGKVNFSKKKIDKKKKKIVDNGKQDRREVQRDFNCVFHL